VKVLRARSPELIREACEAGEAAATQYVLSRLDKKLIRSLDIQITSERGDGTTDTFDVEVSLETEPLVETDLDALSEGATEAALSAIDGAIEAEPKKSKRGSGRRSKEKQGAESEGTSKVKK